MVNRGWFYISYFFCFFSVFLFSLGYSIIPNLLKVDVPQSAYTAEVNATMGIASLASWTPTIGLVIAAAVIICVIFGSFAMNKAVR